MNMHTTNRGSERRPFSLMVKSRVKSRVVFVDVIDISEGGCKVKASRGFASVGDRVTMKLGGINTPLGTIAWIDDRYAGIAFEGQLHQAVLDHLCENNSAHLGPEKQRYHRL